MTLSFKIFVPPMSLNHVEKSTRGGRRYKTDEYKIWAQMAQIEIRKHRGAVAAWAKTFRPIGNAIIAEYTFGLTNLMCKNENRINKKAGDVDNFVKPIQDLVFDFMACHNHEIDDAYVNGTSSRRVETSMPFIEVNYTVVDL